MIKYKLLRLVINVCWYLQHKTLEIRLRCYKLYPKEVTDYIKGIGPKPNYLP